LPTTAPFVRSFIEKNDKPQCLKETMAHLEKTSDEDIFISDSSIYEKLAEIETSFCSSEFEYDELPFEPMDSENCSPDQEEWLDDVFEDADFSACPSHNIDGTLMIEDSCIDINGDVYGCPSSLCD
jgi:hypothetical protein